MRKLSWFRIKKQPQLNKVTYLTFDLKIDAEEYLLLRETRQQYKEQLEKNKELESKYNELSGLVENMLKVEDTSAWRKLE